MNVNHFKTQESNAGRYYDFLLKEDIRRTVDIILVPGAPQANLKWLIGVGIAAQSTKIELNSYSRREQRFQRRSKKLGSFTCHGRAGSSSGQPPAHLIFALPKG